MGRTDGQASLGATTPSRGPAGEGVRDPRARPQALACPEGVHHVRPLYEPAF